MSRLWECENAVSSVIGTILLVGMTVIMVSIIALSVFALGAFEPESAPEAKIVVMESKGGLASAGIAFKNNTILLKHKGGDPLDIKNTKVIITGAGQSHRGFGSTYVPPEDPHVGGAKVIYLNLTDYGKDSIYKTHNEHILQDGFWATGEELLFSGDDGGDADDDESSVWVSVDGDGDTSNNYGFKTGGEINIIVIDAATNQIIYTAYAFIKQP